MKDQALSILIGAIIGSLFTIITNVVWERLKRNRIKKTIQSYLIETITPTTDKIKIELIDVSSAIDKYNSGDVSLGMYPTFNSSLLKSFEMIDLQAIYQENFSKIINIIGYLDNLEKRLPHFYFGDFVKEADNHIEDHYELYKDIYETKNEHFIQCPSIISLRNRTKANLKNVDEIANQLKSHIALVLK